MNHEGPTVRLGNRARDEEAETGARLRLLPAHAAEPLEDQRVMLGCDTGAAVAHLDADRPVVRQRFDLDLAAYRGVLDGVVEQVRQHLPETLPVRANERDRRVDARADPHLVLSALGSRRGLMDEL